MTRGELLDRMSSRELSDWQIYERIDPFGEERADLRIAQLGAAMANLLTDKKSRKRDFTVADFMPFLDQIEPTDDEVAAKVVSIFGGPA